MTGRPLVGQVAVVTGGSRGIGRAVAETLAQAGAKVVVVARERGTTEQAAASLGAHPFSADVAQEEAVAGLAAAVQDRFGRVDVVVHAAGLFQPAPLARTSVASFDQVLAVNLRGAFLLLHAFLPGLLARGAGHFVSIGSVAGRQGLPGNGAYAASKFGLRGLHAVLDAELRGTGVRATLVEPAATDTGLWDDIVPDAAPGLRSRADMLRPEAVAAAVLFALTGPPGTAIRNIIMDRN